VAKSEHDKERWSKMSAAMKYQTCEEAENCWESDWRSCPVCGGRVETETDVADGGVVYVVYHRSMKEITH
jgi:hypothetical protein